jgi:type IV pilus assembly protein PilC
MPKFRYVAMDAKGREVEGVLDADNENRALSTLKDKGLFPTSVTDMGGGRNRGPSRGGVPGKGVVPAKVQGGSREIKMPSFLQPRIKDKQIMIFTRQLATLVDAGLPLLRCLHVLQKQEKDQQFRVALSGMAESVEGGSTFAESMSQYPKVFTPFL